MILSCRRALVAPMASRDDSDGVALVRILLLPARPVKRLGCLRSAAAAVARCDE